MLTLILIYGLIDCLKPDYCTSRFITSALSHTRASAPLSSKTTLKSAYICKSIRLVWPHVSQRRLYHGTHGQTHLSCLTPWLSYWTPNIAPKCKCICRNLHHIHPRWHWNSPVSSSTPLEFCTKVIWNVAKHLCWTESEWDISWNENFREYHQTSRVTSSSTWCGLRRPKELSILNALGAKALIWYTLPASSYHLSRTMPGVYDMCQST